MSVKGADDVVPDREQGHRADRRKERRSANVFRAVPLGGEGHPAADDGHRTEHEQRPDRLVEKDQCDPDGDERGGADCHGRARRPRLPHREREEHLRAAGREQAGGQELPAAMEVVPRQGGHDRDGPRPDEHRKCGRGGTPVAKAEAESDGHRAEGHARRERQQDDGHASLGRRTRRTSVAAAAGSASTIPAMITAQPPQPSAPSRSPASV